MKRILMSFTIAILALILLACEAINEVQETQSDGQIAVTVRDVRRGQETLFGELPEGEMWLIIDLAIQNVGQVRRSIQSLLMFHLEDRYGSYDIDIFADNAFALDGDLEVGERKEGSLVFAVDQRSDEFLLIFTPNINQPGQLEFTIKLHD